MKDAELQTLLSRILNNDLYAINDYDLYLIRCKSERQVSDGDDEQTGASSVLDG